MSVANEVQGSDVQESVDQVLKDAGTDLTTQPQSGQADDPPGDPNQNDSLKNTSPRVIGTKGPNKDAAMKDDAAKRMKEVGFFQGIGNDIHEAGRSATQDPDTESNTVTGLTAGGYVATAGKFATSGVRTATGSAADPKHKTVASVATSKNIKSGASWNEALTEGGKNDAWKNLDGMGQALAVLSLAINTIELAVSVVKFVEGVTKLKDVNQSQSDLKDARLQLAQAKKTLMDAEPAGPEQENKRSEVVGKIDVTMGQVTDQLQSLDQTAAMVARQKNSAVESGVKATMGIVAGALAISGFGAPLLLGATVIGALMAGGSWVADKARNSKASDYQKLAAAMKDDGTLDKSIYKDLNDKKLKGDAKPKPVDYTVMRDRFKAAYYRDPFQKAPTGEKKMDQAIRHFGRKDKLGRLGKPDTGIVNGKNPTFDKSNIRPEAEVPRGPAQEDYWLTKEKNPGKAAVAKDKLEQHKGDGMFGDTFTADPTQGSTATTAAKGELSYALTQIAARTLEVDANGKASFNLGLSVAKVDSSTTGDLSDDQKNYLASVSDAAILKGTGLAKHPNNYWKQRKKLAEKSKADPTSDEVTELTRPWVSAFIK